MSGRTGAKVEKSSPIIVRSRSATPQPHFARPQHEGETATFDQSFAGPSASHDFDQIRVHPEAEATPPTMEARPLGLTTPTHHPLGGTCHTCPAPVQAKLTVNQPNDRYEQEADRVADEVMRMPDPRLQRQEEEPEEEEEEEEELIQAKRIEGTQVQRQVEPEEEEEEEPIQAKRIEGTLVQRQVEPEEEEEEEELIQAKRIEGTLVQRQVEPEEEEEEEEEPLQTKSADGALVQRQEEEPEEEEEETLQTKPLAGQITPLVQRQEEEPEEEEEEEPIQAKRIEGTQVQRQVEPEEEEEEEEELVQTKQANGQSAQAGPDLETQIRSLRGGGQPLSQPTRDFFEPRLVHDFGQVRVHTDARAAELAEAVKARAFTVGQDVVFGAGQYEPRTTSGRKLLAHELVHTIQQGKSRVPGKLTGSIHGEIKQTSPLQVLRQGLLTRARENRAIRFNTRHYDERSIRIIQIITGTNVDGIFGRRSAEAVAAFQQRQGLGVDGMVGTDTLNRMVPNRAAAARHEHAIQLVIDFYNLDVTTDTLSVYYDPTQAAAGTVAFESGNLRVIRLGPPAFVSSAVLRATITAQLAVPGLTPPPAGPRPAVLTRARERAAIRFNRRRFNDVRSVRAIQGHVGSAPDGIWGPDTVQRVAQAQQNARLPIDGMVGRRTIELFTRQLIGTGHENAAIRMIVDFYNIRDDGNLLSVYYDRTVTANAATDYRPNEPVRVRVGPTGLAQPFAGIVHTIAHEYEHVRRLKEGIVPVATHEFLGEAIEILSVGMPEEHLETLAPGAPGYVPGFANDARRALNNWNNMPLAHRRRFRNRFIAVRRRVRNRVAAGTPAQQALHAGLVAAYNAVVLPRP